MPGENAIPLSFIETLVANDFSVMALAYFGLRSWINSSFHGSIYHPVGQFWCKLGGTPEGNQTANLKSVQETLDFLSILKY